MNDMTTPVRRRGRPPKRFDDQFDTRQALVRCGMAVLTEKGFSATGIDSVLRQVGVPKGSFYHYFDSKEAFGREVIAAYADYFARKIDAALDDTSRPPLARLQAFVDDAAAGMARFDFRRGCLIGNLGQEMASLPEAYRAQLEAVFADWERRVARCLAAAQAAGEIGAGVDCARMAAFFWTGWEGAVLRAKLVRAATPLHLFADEFIKALRA
ncbi:MAG: TetR/AcrR family transcriptional regulator [Rhodocyclaceae bacterium]|nr:TetR/AcrR family transcriptional regulator [Rhodocyclaceae bacterium]